MKTPPRPLAAKGSIALCCSIAFMVGCTPAGDRNTSAGGPSVPPGATKEQYAAALADMEPIQLTTQNGGSPGSPQAIATEMYADALEEWSGGKITVDIGYGNAYADPSQADQALDDGRLDFSQVIPQYDPSRYRAYDQLDRISLLGSTAPASGLLQTNAALLDLALSTPEIESEFAANGMKVLLPAVPRNATALTCREANTQLSDSAGRTARIGVAAHREQSEALGLSPVSLPYPEVYEGFQRGTIDCAVAALFIANLGGFLPVARHVVLDPEASFVANPAAYAFGLRAWEQLPLAAQQLIFDRLDTYITGRAIGEWLSVVEAVRIIEENNGEVSELAPDARAALAAANAQIIDNVRASNAIADSAEFVDSAELVFGRWRTVVEGELGYPANQTYYEFADSFDPESVDLTAYLNLLATEILNAHRPESDS